MELEDYFSVEIFFIILRETLESAIIISVLLSYLKQELNPAPQHSKPRSEAEEPLAAALQEDSEQEAEERRVRLATAEIYRRLRMQIWVGAFLGLFICLLIGGLFIFIFYSIHTDLYAATERYWEGVFSILSSIVISVMGLALLRVTKLQHKWKVKLAKSLFANEDFHRGGFVQVGRAASEAAKPPAWRQRARRFTERYAMGLLPFVTTLREGLEAVVFIGGVGVNQKFSAFPLAVLAGVAIGGAVGYLMYKGGNTLSLRTFLIISTAFLYLVAAGLFSKGVWFFELQQFINKVGQDVSESGSGPGSYDIANTVWHVNCCNGQTDPGWMIFNAIFGWQNSATYGSVISYNVYWIAVIVVIYNLWYEEQNGRLPFVPLAWQQRRISKRNMRREEAAQYLARLEARGTPAGARYGTVAGVQAAERPSTESADSRTALTVR